MGAMLREGNQIMHSQVPVVIEIGLHFDSGDAHYLGIRSQSNKPVGAVAFPNDFEKFLLS